MDIIYQERSLPMTEQGFLLNMTDWDHEVATQLADANNINIEPAHWEIILFIRDYYLHYKHLPNARVFTKAIAKALGPDKGNSRYLHGLFPDGPLQLSCKLAGLPKPPTCL